MNRTALCIKMLTLLKTSAQMSTQEIAGELNTNPRNIREYRKELEVAGYHIEEVRGRYGGYRLDEKCLLPMVGLSHEERKSLQKTLDFLKASPDFDEGTYATDALRRILSSNTHTPDQMPITYVRSSARPLNEEEKRYKQILENACENHTHVLMNYQSLQSQEPIERLFDPYELVLYEDWYVIGWDHYRKDYRCFRISSSRMLHLEPLETTFLRDSHFNIGQFVNENRIFQGKFISYTVRLKADFERLFLERNWGQALEKKEEQDGYVLYSFLNERSSQVFSNLFACSNHVELLEPARQRKAYIQKLQEALSIYGGNE